MFKRIVVFTVVVALLGTGIATGTASLYARIFSEPATIQERNISTHIDVLSKAHELNHEIVAEIDGIREKRRREIELLEAKRREEHQNLKNFVESTKDAGFTNYDLRTPSNLTGEQIEVILRGTELEGLGTTYAEAEIFYGINALVLVGISAHESGWGTSKLARERNNLFGFQAYDSDIDKAMYFDSKEECILHVARHLSEKYLSPDGRYHKGYTLSDVNYYYASDEKWSVKIASMMGRFVNQLESEV